MNVYIYIDEKNFANYYEMIFFLYLQLLYKKYFPIVITSLENIKKNSKIIPVSQVSQKIYIIMIFMKY